MAHPLTTDPEVDLILDDHPRIEDGEPGILRLRVV
jgi:hypothetical protein